MTGDDYYIIDEPLPDALNFAVLKRDGIKQLQALSGKVWTNYNESDPGITILDQLCYALTELGYCAQFPIADVLTQADGTIHFQDQFFEPQNILTSTPVTPDDYRKLVLAHVPQVRVIYIEPESVSVPEPGGDSRQTLYTGRYKSYLSLKDSSGQTDVDQIINAVHVLLNQHRNLAEWFLRPKNLTPLDIQLAGTVWLTPSANAAKVESLIAQALLNYAAPAAVQSGYKELLAQGLNPEDIFNGPKTCNGWIAGKDALKAQCLNVSVSDLTGLIAGIDGVWYVESLSFSGYVNTNAIAIKKTELPNFTLSDTFKLVRNGIQLNTEPNHSGQPYLAALSSKHQAASVEAKIDLFPELPQGNYRNIEDYYSVQNTFPDVYGIGYNSLQSDAGSDVGSDAASYRVAQSRQLKGYLMAFDQLLANQFSQVAHIGDLFSFGIPYSKPEQTGLPNPGLPYKKFTTTYHCQPLYDIPQVKPLLRGHEAFHYQVDPGKPDEQVENEAWKKYKNFQFNEYIYGLRQHMENELEATTRRDAMLSHLMARHGDDAILYDEMIETCQWFGSELKTRIIVKTIWLQNFELLSYNRTRAFNVSAVKLLPMPGDASIIDAINQHDAASSTDVKVQDVKKSEKQQWWHRPVFPTLDGEVDQTKIFSEARLKPSDFEHFSTFEHKAGILLGLPRRWRSLAGTLYALLDAPDFHDWLNNCEPRYRLADSDISVTRGQGQDKKHQLVEGNQCLMDIVCSSAATAEDYQQYADQLLWLSTQRKGFLLIESILLVGNPQPQLVAPYFLTASLIFPNYVTLIQQPKFQNFIDTLVSLHWPAYVEMHYVPTSFDGMKGIISNYVDWKNNRDNCNSLLHVLSQKKADDPTLSVTRKAAKAAFDLCNSSKGELASKLGLSAEKAEAVQP
jgi:hypothetical protein